MSISDKDWSDRNIMLDEIRFLVKSWKQREFSEIAIKQVMQYDCRYFSEAEEFRVTEFRYSLAPESIQ